MRGAVEFTKARLAGYVPGYVSVDLDFGRLDIREGAVQIEADDRMSSLDLRCVHGLTVAISATNAARAHAVAQVCVECGARRVITTVSRALTNGTFDVIEVADTEGTFTWKK